MVEDDESSSLSSLSARFPCGRIIPNRFVKVAMYEHLASFGGGYPNERHINLYTKWSRGGWGMITTGNVQIHRSHLTLGRDMCIPTKDSPDYVVGLEAFRKLAFAMHDYSDDSISPLAIMQLSHAGRQSPRFIGGRLPWRRPVGPSSIPVGHDINEGFISRTMYNVMFQTPIPLKEFEVKRIVNDFCHATRVAVEAGFDGVQLHASHGYLLSQFMSRKLNNRSDIYADGSRLLFDIVTSVRQDVPSTFIIGIKLNSGDYVSGGLGGDAASLHLQELAQCGVDYIEISGGDYENPEFISSSSPRQAFFENLSLVASMTMSRMPQERRPLILLTGGLRTVSQSNRALSGGHCQLLGFGRPSVLCTDLPKWTQKQQEMGHEPWHREPALTQVNYFPKLIGAGTETAWYVVQMRRISYGQSLDLNMGGLCGVWRMWIWNPSLIALVVVVFLCIIASYYN